MNVSGINKIVGIVNRAKAQSIAKQAVKDGGSTEFFCHKYWKWAQNEGAVRNTNNQSVSLHGYLNSINHHFINSPYPKTMDEKFFQTNMTPREMISVTDFDFKELKPTTEKITAFRCIGKKPEFFSEYPLYQKRCAIKKGDIIDMKEYAYATPDINYARCYLPNNKGILYEFEIPENARVSRTAREIVFPRSSKFECLDVKRIKDSDNDYIHAKLRYILPDEPWRN